MDQHLTDPSTVSHRASNTEGEEDYEDLTESVRLVKEVIAVVDSKVNEHEKRRRLKEFHARMDSKSIMMMKSGQIFAKEDLLRRRLIHDGVLHLKSNQARLKGKEAPTVGPPVLCCVFSSKHKFLDLLQRSTLCFCRMSLSSSKRKTRSISLQCW